MVIVSISLNDKMLEEVDGLQNELGFSGRSEVVRAGLRTFISENNEKKLLTGKISSVLLVVHGKESEEDVTEAKHDFEDIITTHIHNSLKDGKCLEIFILIGDAERVKKFFGLLNINKYVDYIKLVTT